MWHPKRKCIPAIFLLFLLICCEVTCDEQDNNNKRDTNKQPPELSNLMRHWAQKLAGELYHFGEMITRRNMVIESYKSTSVVEESGLGLLKEVHENLSKMVKQKVAAVERIMDTAEQAAKLSQCEKDVDVDFQYYNVKNLTNSLANTTAEPQTDEVRWEEPNYQAMVQNEDDYQLDQETNNNDNDNTKTNEESDDSTDSELEVTDGSEKDPQASQVPQIDKTKLPLYPHRHFHNIPVNINYSAVHVPSNVYDRSNCSIAGIKWSEELDHIFKSNYKNDPSLSWQYFGSSTGFMRQYPAMIWSEEPIDLFDCRTRSWYIEAASSPKDMIILVDRSGSMTGIRREIARHVVHNILDTLGNNDYVNIYTFSNTTEPLVDCFEGRLVEANLANVRVLKEAMTDFKTEQIANFSLALITAFELLANYRSERKGADCNQAIMLVTDGVQYNYKEIFEKYNWENDSDNYRSFNVRVFTYLIGREASDVREVKWMACANRGFYVHLSTYAEVREEVLNYISVMARPLVLTASKKPNPAWSPVYADVTDPKLTNWLWINRERNRQRERFIAYRKNKTLLPQDEQDKKFVHQQKYKQDNYGELQTYRLMTSVSLPVYDKNPRAERVANLLGVAGTDIPIEYIESLMLPYRLGVNGYAFITDNNGYLVTHPDLRPVYQGILKPSYNRVDMLEVEIADDETQPREFSDVMRQFRNRVVHQQNGSLTLRVKTHLDDMRRLITSTRYYYYTGIENTPFSLVVALPHKYGFYRVQHSVEIDVHRLVLKTTTTTANERIKGSLTQFFTGNWTIHPDWHYCRYLDNRLYFDTPEEELLHFLKIMDGPGWKWSPGECDRKLVCKVVADAMLTKWFSQNITNSTKEADGAEFIKRFGITVAFLATHSGLTRWQDFPQNIGPNREHPHFRVLNNRAIDEVWYRRAVEQYYKDPATFVYSVPFDVGDTDKENMVVTVSHAIFREDDAKKAPAAVVGYQCYHRTLTDLFQNITRSCGDIPCKRTCESNELHCLILDDNGYVIISDDPKETGYFFGKLRPDIMGHLLDDGIYTVTRMFDYQGLCAEARETNNFASTMSKLQPLRHLSRLLEWFLATLLMLLRSVSGAEFETFLYPDQEQDPNGNNGMESSSEPVSRYNEKEFDQRILIQKTRPEPCDQEIFLYNLVHYTDRNISSSGYNRTSMDCNNDKPYMVQRIFRSNMILLVVNNVCREDQEKVTRMPDPVKVDYNMTLPCYMALHNDFDKRHYMTCINKNANESEINICGAGTYVISSKQMTAFFAVLSIALTLRL